MHRQLLQPVRTDTASALELRAAIATARVRLLDVLQDRARTLAAPTSWVGPHRRRYEQDATDLLRAGHELDRALAGLQSALDAEIDAVTP